VRDFPVARAVAFAPLELKKVEQVGDGRTVLRHIGIAGIGDGVGEVVSTSVCDRRHIQFRSTNLMIETWSAYWCEMYSRFTNGETMISEMRVPSPKKSSGCT
jgi:hypothetical protein